MPHIEALAFDFDGVLADSIPVHTNARREAFLRLGYDVSDEIHEQAHNHGAQTADIIGWILQQIGVVDNTLDVDALRENPVVGKVVTLKRQLYNREAMAGLLPAIPGSIDFVRRAVRRYGAEKLAIATTAHKKYEVNPYLERYGLGDAFRIVIGGESFAAGMLKPDPLVYNQVCQALEVPADNIVAIEDSPAGVYAAVAAQYGGVYAITTTHDRAQLREATRVFDSFTALSMELL